MFISILIVSAMVIILNLISVTGVLCFVLYLAAYWVIGYHILKKAGKDKLRLVKINFLNTFFSRYILESSSMVKCLWMLRIRKL